SGSWCQVCGPLPFQCCDSTEYTPTEKRVAIACSTVSRIVTYSTLNSSCQSIASQCAGYLGHLFSHLMFCASLSELSCQSTRRECTINAVHFACMAPTKRLC